MCWNKEVSGLSFIFISLVSFLFYKRNLDNDRLLAFFILSYGGMQLFEFFIWTGIDYSITSLNIFGSFLAAILLYFHPLAITLGMKQDNAYKQHVKTKFYKRCLIAASILFGLGVLYTLYHLLFKKTRTFIAFKDKLSGHLVWDFPQHYGIVLIIMIITATLIWKQNKPFSLLFLGYFLIPLVIIRYTFKYAAKDKHLMARGSYWCWYVAIFSIALYIANPYLQNNKKK